MLKNDNSKLHTYFKAFTIEINNYSKKKEYFLMILIVELILLYQKRETTPDERIARC